MALFGHFPGMRLDAMRAARLSARATQGNVAAAQQPSPAPGGAFFGKNGVGRAIAGSIGDLLLQQAGAAPVYAPAMENRLRQRMQEMAEAREDERYRRRLAGYPHGYSANGPIDSSYPGGSADRGHH